MWGGGITPRVYITLLAVKCCVIASYESVASPVYYLIDFRRWKAGATETDVVIFEFQLQHLAEGAERCYEIGSHVSSLDGTLVFKVRSM